MRFSNYQKAVHYLIHDIPKTSRKVFDDQKAIEKNFQLMAALDNPQNIHPTIHVAGTSGKGTVCYLIDALLRAHTKRTGMTQSPHVYDIRERVQINGQLISEKKFVAALNTVLAADTNQKSDISYFETITAMGFWSLANEPLDYAIFETGMGGRLDASNVIERKDKLCVITKIGLDHTEALGETLEKIATEKAGIIHSNNHVIALSQEPEINKIFESRCLEVGATLEWVSETGDYQNTNDAIALRACEYLAQRDGWKFEGTLAHSVLSQVFIPGRFEKRHLKDHLVILDGAHNPQKLSALVNRIQSEHKDPVTIIYAAGERKDIESCVKTLSLVAKRIVVTEYFSEEKDIPVRPTPTSKIAELCEKLSVPVIESPVPQQAVRTALSFSEPVVVTGSFYLIGEIDKAF